MLLWLILSCGLWKVEVFLVEKLVCEGKGKGFGFWVLRYWQWLGLRIGGKVDGDRDMDVVAIPICYHFVYLPLASVMSEGVNSWVLL